MSLTSYKPLRRGRLASELEEYIRSGIRRGDLKAGQRLGSAKQLAKEWKTSYGAVRQSLETLAAKGLVERRARAGTFIASESDATSERDVMRNIIGLLVPDIRIPEYGLVTRAMQDASQIAGSEILVSSTDNHRDRYDQSVMRHLKAGVSGLILVAPQYERISLQTLVEIEKSGIPIVNFARTVDVVPWPTVQTDVFQATYLPVKHLCDLGRKHIGFVSFPMPASYSMRIRYGLFRALADAGLVAENVAELIVPDDSYLRSWSDTRALYSTLNKWLDEHPKLDAICCKHDHIAIAVLKVLEQRGVKVPDDIALTGSGSGLLPDFFGIHSGDLTSIDTRIDLAAAEMVRLLQNGVEANRNGEPRVIEIMPELRIGRSTVKDHLSEKLVPRP